MHPSIFQQEGHSGPESLTCRFFTFPLISRCKTIDPQGGTIFSPRAIILRNMKEVDYVMLHTNYQGSRLCGFRQEDFFTFSLYKPM